MDALAAQQFIPNFVSKYFFDLTISTSLASAISPLIFFKYLSLDFSLLEWLILGVLTSCLGTLGDLVESQFKREAGVKDSGKLMPGHGGLYDRMDSIIFAAPFIYLSIIIFKNVS